MTRHLVAMALFYFLDSNVSIASKHTKQKVDHQIAEKATSKRVVVAHDGAYQIKGVPYYARLFARQESNRNPKETSVYEPQLATKDVLFVRW